MGRLDGKTVIITGAAGGQGKVAVNLFTKEGVNVIAGDIVDKREEVLVQAEGNPGEVTFIQADVTKEEEVQKLVSAAINQYGKIDGLYNNHGIMLGSPFLETNMEEFDEIVNANLRSVFMLNLYVAKEMSKQKSGSIINVSSVGGVVGFPGMAAYGAAKGGVAQLSRSMATDLSEYNVRVNTICPGVIDTPMPRKYSEGAEDVDAVRRDMENMHLLKRYGTPEEVVWLAIYLISDESSFMTGAVIPIDGGLTAV